MSCPNILNINLSGRTMIWLILIIVNLGFLVIASLKYNPFETFTNLNENNSLYSNFLKKLEFYSSNRRNKIINQVRPTYLQVINNSHRNNMLDNNIIEYGSIAEPSLINNTKSQPKPIRRHTENDNNNRNENKHHYNSNGILFGLVRSFFPQRHHERHHQRHHQIHHERHNQRHSERHHHFHV